MKRFVWILCFSACMPPPAASLRGKPEVTAGDYDKVLEAWTRGEQIYSIFEHKMQVKATFITPALRKAFQARFPEIYGYGGQITRKELVDIDQKTEETLNFFVVVYTPDYKWNDLNKSDSIWHLTLGTVAHLDTPEDPHALRLDAISIERVKIDENLRTVYPYITSFDQAYLVRFPAVGKDQHGVLSDKETILRMRIASSFGAADLNWDVLP